MFLFRFVTVASDNAVRIWSNMGTEDSVAPPKEQTSFGYHQYVEYVYVHPPVGVDILFLLLSLAWNCFW